MSAWPIPAHTGTVELPQPFEGAFDTLPFSHVQYECAGCAERGVVVVLGGISATHHVTANQIDDSPGWWQAQAGAGRAIDTDEYAVLGVDYLGARLADGARVPRVDTRDQARAIACVLDHLGIARIEAIVGSSYGGMVALAFAALYPERVGQLVVIGAAHEPHPMATAVRSVQRSIVTLTQAYGCAADGLSLARQLAMTTYRTAEEFAQRFSAQQPVQHYLAHCGARYVQAFTPERFLCLSQSIDDHRVEPADISVPVTLVAIEGDAIAPPWQIRDLARLLGSHARLVEIQSRFGHDAFLKETAAISNILIRTLRIEANI